jgi:hypothetical protein
MSQTASYGAAPFPERLGSPKVPETGTKAQRHKVGLDKKQRKIP